MATIAENLGELVFALEAEDVSRAKEIADRVFRLQHNSGPLVPGLGGDGSGGPAGGAG